MFSDLKSALMIIVAVLAVAGVRADGQARMKQTNSKTISPGDWGGVGIHAVADGSGISIELDCASANIGVPLRVDRNGKFSVAGSFTEASRGPIRVGHQPKPQPAHFSGAVSDRSMKLKITIDSSRETVGTYSLQHGKEGVLHRCR